MDVLALVYFGCLFDVKPQSEFAAMMLTRKHERGCCLTDDYMTDGATDLLGEQDLDAISALGSLVTSRSTQASLIRTLSRPAFSTQSSGLSTLISLSTLRHHSLMPD